jgi:hypothetical protein
MVSGWVRLRHVRAVCNYGLFDRREAQQYYPSDSANAPTISGVGTFPTAEANRLRRVSKLSDHLGYWLRLVSIHVSITFARKLAAEEVTVAEWLVLRVLFDAENFAPSKLATTLA